ncbi:MAG: 3-isopropylmalate dehydrogenase, partial [Bryobacterales bacterium]|nr:3-isopropylmalate dehydrogenase [Bryobacterales bacterium]
MQNYRIQVIAGDGIGGEVTACAMRVMEKAAARHGFRMIFEEHDWGSEHYFRHGRMMPVNALDTLRPADAILLGAVGHPDIPDHVTLHGLLLPIRRGFDQYVNVRPAVLYPGVESPLKHFPPREIDMVVIRENTEGEYAPVGGFVHQNQADEVAVQSSVFTRHGCERVIRYAFELAGKRNKKRVTSVTKSNAQAYSMVLWDRVFQSVAREFPEIETESLLVDAAAMNFVRRPHSFDVVVASNLFGDILSDLSAIVAGSIGLAASANLDPSRRSPSLFEPVHGSAPDIAGRGIANPLAAILCASMLLDHLGQGAAAAAIEQAVRRVLAEGA